MQFKEIEHRRTKSLKKEPIPSFSQGADHFQDLMFCSIWIALLKRYFSEIILAVGKDYKNLMQKLTLLLHLLAAHLDLLCL